MKGLSAIITGVVLSLANISTANAESRLGLYLIPYVGASALGDQDASGSGLTDINGDLDVAVEGGFVGGLALRFHSASRWSSEFGWEYRSNDSVITNAAGVDLPGGNYASNIFYFNGRYALASPMGQWVPWVGGGLTIVQEIDLDSEGVDDELSFSDNGAVGFQVMAGVDRYFADKWLITGEVRYSDLRDLTLKQEAGGDGVVEEINYQPVSVQIGVGYRF